ncbi:hypothetical protein JCM24511_03465 [Saitozyma sp. JCM 24511]|nr:hypothetical protein JCM24511_03465 [Saitozyma sp. JCM 24511]
MTTTNPPVPSAESLSVSASLFTSRISSWLPANFGASSSTSHDKLDILFERTSEDETSRLGLGHPRLDLPRGGAPTRGAGAGLAHLQRRLAKGKGAARAESTDSSSLGVTSRDDDADEDEGESRASSVGRRKRSTALDLLSGKKGKKSGSATPALSAQSSARPSPVPPQLDSAAHGDPVEDRDSAISESKDDSHPSPSFDDGNDDSGPATPTHHTATSSPGGSGIFPFSGPLALDSPRAKRIIKDRPVSRAAPAGGIVKADNAVATTEDQGSENDAVDFSVGRAADGGLEAEAGRAGATVDPPHKGSPSKTQLRREKRKAAKLAHRVREAAERR